MLRICINAVTCICRILELGIPSRTSLSCIMRITSKLTLSFWLHFIWTMLIQILTFIQGRTYLNISFPYFHELKWILSEIFLNLNIKKKNKNKKMGGRSAGINGGSLRGRILIRYQLWKMLIQNENNEM